jgi:hypothetical protein
MRRLGHARTACCAADEWQLAITAGRAGEGCTRWSDEQSHVPEKGNHLRIGIIVVIGYQFLNLGRQDRRLRAVEVLTKGHQKLKNFRANDRNTLIALTLNSWPDRLQIFIRRELSQKGGGELDLNDALVEMLILSIRTIHVAHELGQIHARESAMDKKTVK